MQERPSQGTKVIRHRVLRHKPAAPGPRMSPQAPQSTSGSPGRTLVKGLFRSPGRLVRLPTALPRPQGRSQLLLRERPGPDSTAAEPH
ncbi:hypothetical protein NDU88_005072 [Pleurodeles waltl]|uniref:Uncharacterized protein n=1 Tax=Pleurodeles waltl TaxID=8319 RepID=A0AAV7V6P7_PLEWA|nr:hypothetical protein NDU88_005072 [Pleurodeles waltl]